MRTTLTLDDDVASQIEAWRKDKDLTFEDAINIALRRGMAEIAKPGPRKKFRTKTFDLGECYYPNLDNISEVLEDADNEWFAKKLKS